jgi:hypothetical protein
METPPPIGVMPKWLWLEHNPVLTVEAIDLRLDALSDAIDRFNEHDRETPDAWWDELKNLFPMSSRSAIILT